MRAKWWAAGLLFIWLVAIAFGMHILMTHETEPGQRQSTIVRIDKAEFLNIPSTQTKPYLLIMFAHPHCVCTKASLSELGWLAEHCKPQLQPIVMMVKPDGAPEDWVEAENWKLAKSLSDVSVQIDENAQWAKKFGALTSGHTFLIDQDGNVLFSGGVTQARGVEGENDGRRAIYTMVTEKKSLSAQPRPVETKVFGCLLY